jgi:hypothetical protein
MKGIFSVHVVEKRGNGKAFGKHVVKRKGGRGINKRGRLFKTQYAK